MNIRATFALIMGLLLQWSMVQAFPDATPAEHCATASAPMACCASKQVCPCVVDKGESGEKPAPLAPASPVLKLVFVGVPSTDNSVEIAAISVAVHGSPYARADSVAGYPGVPLSVAFCSFVI